MENRNQTPGSTYKDVSEKLESFSRHLMLILVAVVAFSASTSLETSNSIPIILYVLGVVLSIISFIAGHEASAAILSAYLMEDNSFKPIPPDKTFDSTLISKIRLRVELQYWFSLAALLLISTSVVISVIDKPEVDYSDCNINANGRIICPSEMNN